MWNGIYRGTYRKIYDCNDFLPNVGILLYAIVYPRESTLFGNKCRFDNESVEPSDKVIKCNRAIGATVLIIVIIMLVVALFR